MRLSTSAVLVMGLVCFVAGCAHTAIPDETLTAVAEAQVDPCDVTLICHGMLKDLGGSWYESLEEELREQGRLGIIITYWSTPLGVWFNWGAVAPGKLLARIAEDLKSLHDRSGCPRPLRVHGVAFSNGCEAFLEAGRRVSTAQFHRVVFLKSSSLPLPFQVNDLLASKDFGDVLNVWSPWDLATLLAPLGAGSFGLWSRHDGLSNEFNFYPHLPWCITEKLRSHVNEWTAQPIREAQPSASNEYRRLVRDYLASGCVSEAE